MALSGSSNKVFGAKNAFRVRIYWSATQNVSGNSSRVTADLYLESIVSWGAFGDATSSSTYITINGNKKSFSVVASLRGNQSKKLGSHSVTVPHNSDGTKTFSISGAHHLDVTYSGSYLGTQTTSGSYSLNTIPRTSTARLNKTSADIGTSVRITIGKASSGFTHTLNYNWSGKSGNIVTKTSSSTVDWTIPTSFYATLKNTTSSGGTIYCDTYSGNTKIGVVSLKLTITVPGRVVPSFSGISVTDSNTAINALVGASTYVQELSNIKLTLTGASGSQSSTIKSYTINFNGKNYGSSVASVGSISRSGTVTGSAYVTDSRGRRSASKSVSISLLPYANPTISVADVSRTEGGVGEDVVVRRTGRISGLGGKNKSLIYLDYKETGATSWINIGAMTATGALGVEAFNLTQTTTGNLFKKAKSYEFRINVNDSLTYTTATPTISTASVTMSLGKEGVGIGKVWEQGALDLTGSFYINGARQDEAQMLPPGNGSLAYWHNLQQGVYFANKERTVPGAPSSYGLITVLKHAEEFSVMWEAQHSGATYRLSGNSDGFQGVATDPPKWFVVTEEKVSTVSGDLLWTGAIFPNADAVITPSKKMSECPNGWVFVWSAYDAGAGQNHDWSYTFVPKSHTSGAGVLHNISAGSSAGLFLNKYLYTSDTHVEGNNSNGVAPANKIVLREIRAW